MTRVTCDSLVHVLASLQLVKEAQALHVRSEMAALATEARSLMGEESWLPPESPHPPGGTRLPHMFGALAHQRMVNLVSVVASADECHTYELAGTAIVVKG